MVASKKHFFYIFGQNNTIIKSKKRDFEITLLGLFFENMPIMVMPFKRKSGKYPLVYSVLEIIRWLDHIHFLHQKADFK